MRLNGRLDRLRGPQTRRRVLSLADQGVSSLSNVVVAVLVARAFDSSVPFGAFSLAMVAYQIVMSGLRAMVGEPLLSLYSHESSGVRQKLVADLYGTTLFLGALCSLVLWGVAVVMGGLSGSALLALAVVLTPLLLQDTLRFLFIVDRPGAALVIDTVWLVVVVAAIPLAPADAPVAWFVLAWGLAGGLGAVVGIAIGGDWPGWPHPWRWLVTHRSTSLRYLGEVFTARSSSQLVLVGLGAIAGLGALGAAKASLTYFGVLNTLHMGLYLVVVPEGVRARRDPGKLRRVMGLVAGTQVALALAWTAAGMVLPDAWGREMLRGTWHDAEELMLPMGLAMVGGGVLSGGFLGLRSLGDARRSFAARMHSTLWQTVCPLIGAVVEGAVGFAVGFAVGRAVAAAIWWRTFDRGLADASSLAPGETSPPATAMPDVPDVDQERLAIS